MKPTIKFLGVGGAFAPITKGHSNMLVTAETGERMLIDCGSAVQFTLKPDFNLTPSDIDAIWISHLHADHIGSLEWFAFYRYFVPNKDKDGKTIKPKLYMIGNLMQELWETSLKGGLQSVEGKIMNLTDYFDCIPVDENSFFNFGGLICTPVQTIHVMSGYMFKHSYGLLLLNDKTGKRTFVTTDTQFCPYQLRVFYNQANQIFHDCETLITKSHVHAHYEDLKTLPVETKNKMWLYHYADKVADDTLKADGFLGFVEKGQEFDL
jgi:ribonuclease BN (tRNA processing enzyme)